MLTTKHIKHSLLISSLVALLSLGSTATFAGEMPGESRTYVDPLTGEVKEATKLLSEMTDEEKSVLSNEEYKALKELEDKIEAAKAAKKQKPGY